MWRTLRWSMNWYMTDTQQGHFRLSWRTEDPTMMDTRVCCNRVVKEAPLVEELLAAMAREPTGGSPGAEISADALG